jgi:hydroxyacylglutathione hydrolase
MQIDRIPMLEDNYSWLLTCPQTGTIAVVDAPEAAPVLALTGGRLDLILNTHHHRDHVGANLELKAATGCRIIGPAPDADRIPGIDQGVDEGDRVQVGASEAAVMFVPGHTRGHIAFWFAEEKALFCGDTLFSLGCGRLFEGTADQMWQALSRFRTLPPETRIYCAHEYTAANARFARHIDPDNPDLAAFAEDIAARRSRGEATVPSLMQKEILANPFLRADNAALSDRLGLANQPPAAVFAEIRRQKDSYR